MALLTVSGVSKKENGIFAVKNVSFTQKAFQKIAVAGETGSGKTTLLKLIAGLAQPDAGEILFDQKKIKSPNDHLIPGNKGIAYLSQHFELRNNYWVHEILSYANELTQQEADTLYKICRIDHLLNRRTDQLSGGEKQRIALARLLIGAPKLLLLDEPFSNLDAQHKRIIKSVIQDINDQLKISCIMVSHDAADILSWADVILIMKEGTLIQQGTPEHVYHQPVNEYCAGLLGEYNLVSAKDAIMLNGSINDVSGKRKLLVRPEAFLINTAGKGLQAIVQDKIFLGSYYMMDVESKHQTFKIKTTGEKYTRGETVWLTVAPADNWTIDN